MAEVVQPPEDTNVIKDVAGLVPPVTTPDTTPLEEPMVAIPVLLLVQVPIPSVRVADAPWHIASGPAIGAGVGVTVTTVVAVQPVTGNV